MAEVDRQAMIEERIRQEANAAAIRSDVTEELDRLKAHLAEMGARHPEQQRPQPGQASGFLTQEWPP